MAPTNEVLPTIKSESEVAIVGSTAKNTTRIGTVRIDPPPPMRPNTMPMRNAPMYPMISMSHMF
jgi:hypothetical protein